MIRNQRSHAAQQSAPYPQTPQQMAIQKQQHHQQQQKPVYSPTNAYGGYYAAQGPTNQLAAYQGLQFNGYPNNNLSLQPHPNHVADSHVLSPAEVVNSPHAWSNSPVSVAQEAEGKSSEESGEEEDDDEEEAAVSPTSPIGPSQQFNQSMPYAPSMMSQSYNAPMRTYSPSMANGYIGGSQALPSSSSPYPNQQPLPYSPPSVAKPMQHYQHPPQMPGNVQHQQYLPRYSTPPGSYPMIRQPIYPNYPPHPYQMNPRTAYNTAEYNNMYPQHQQQQIRPGGGYPSQYQNYQSTPQFDGRISAPQHRNTPPILPSPLSASANPQQFVTPPRAAPFNDSYRLISPVAQGVIVNPFRLKHGEPFTSIQFQIPADNYRTLTSRLDLDIEMKSYVVKQDQVDIMGASTELPCEWPPFLTIRLNHHPLDLSKIHRSVLLKQFIVQGLNLLEMFVTSPAGQPLTCLCSHCFIIRFVSRPSIPSIINDTLQRRIMKKDACIRRLQSIFNKNDEEISSDYLILKLADPVSMLRLHIPARGKDCVHETCFDLEYYLKLNADNEMSSKPGSNLWKCPFCKGSAEPNALWIDEYILEIVRNMEGHPDIAHLPLEIKIVANGEWNFYFNETSVNVCSPSDSNSPSSG